MSQTERECKRRMNESFIDLPFIYGGMGTLPEREQAAWRELGTLTKLSVSIS